MQFDRCLPERGVLYHVVEKHWPAFRARAEQGGGLPSFVVREVSQGLKRLDDFRRRSRWMAVETYGLARFACARLTPRTFQPVATRSARATNQRRTPLSCPRPIVHVNSIPDAVGGPSLHCPS